MGSGLDQWAWQMWLPISMGLGFLLGLESGRCPCQRKRRLIVDVSGQNGGILSLVLG